VLTESAWAASRTKNTFLSSKYKRLAGRRGKKRAIVAVGHAILTIVYHLIKEKKSFQELGATYIDEKKREGQIKYFQKRLQELGAENPEKKKARKRNSLRSIFTGTSPDESEYETDRKKPRGKDCDPNTRMKF